jgi:hypothetical protein
MQFRTDLSAIRISWQFRPDRTSDRSIKLSARKLSACDFNQRFRIPCGGKETWYSLFVSGGWWSPKVIEAHSRGVIFQTSFHERPRGRCGRSTIAAATILRQSTVAVVLLGRLSQFADALDRFGLARSFIAAAGGLGRVAWSEDEARISCSAVNQCCSASPSRQPDDTQISYARSRIRSDKFRSMGLPHFPVGSAAEKRQVGCVGALAGR